MNQRSEAVNFIEKWVNILYKSCDRSMFKESVYTEAIQLNLHD